MADNNGGGIGRETSKSKTSKGIPWSEVPLADLPGMVQDGKEAAALLAALIESAQQKRPTVLSARALDCLWWNNPERQQQDYNRPPGWLPDPATVAKFKPIELLRAPNFGRVSLIQVAAWLRDNGYPNWLAGQPTWY